jgi:hypothetical protein
MAQKRARSESSTINRAAFASPADLERYCRGLDNWPRSWMGSETDLPPGEKLIACLRPFLHALAASGQSRKTIQKHVDNLWLLGGEVIRDLNQHAVLRKVPVERLLSNLIENGGPLLYHSDSEQQQQQSFDSTCRKLRRFLAHPTH